MDAEACIEAQFDSPLFRDFRVKLFSKIVPNVKSLGFLSDRQRHRFEELGILHFETGTKSDVDHDMEMERRQRAGHVEQTAA